MSLHTSEIARREGSDVQLRPEPLRIQWSFDDLVASDGHALRGTFAAAVRALPHAAERRMLEEVFLTGAARSVTADRVAQHFHSAFRAAAAKACESRPAADWLHNGSMSAVVDALKSAGQRVAFSCGLELLPPFDLSLDSPTLEQQRLESMQRSLAEQRHAGQLEHVQRSAELLRQFNAIRESAPQLSPGEILSQLTPSDQAPLLQTLLLASAKEQPTTALYAVAGSNLLTINPQKSPPQTDVTPLPATLGPLRSVQRTADGALLVGARSGVFRTMTAADPQSDWLPYADSEITSPLGFNAAILWNDTIVATHSEAGVVAWKLNQPDHPLLALRPADLNDASPKNLCALDDHRLVISTSDSLLLLSRAKGTAAVGSASADAPAARSETTPFAITPLPTNAGAEIVAILPEPNRLTLVFNSGLLQLRDRDTLSLIRQERRSGPLCTAALLPWLGSTRLLLATEAGPIFCLSWDDELITQFLSPHRELRALAAAHDVIAALSADRQRLFLWQTWSPRAPIADLYLPSIARHRAADVAL
jgi:hypothetical protein